MPARLDALEKEQKALEEALADPDLFSRDPDAFNAKICPSAAGGGRTARAA